MGCGASADASVSPAELPPASPGLSNSVHRNSTDRRHSGDLGSRKGRASTDGGGPAPAQRAQGSPEKENGAWRKSAMKSEVLPADGSVEKEVRLNAPRAPAPPSVPAVSPSLKAAEASLDSLQLGASPGRVDAKYTTGAVLGASRTSYAVPTLPLPPARGTGCACGRESP